MNRRPLVVVGDSLLDRDVEGRVDRLCPDAPVPVLQESVRSSRPGGAALAAVMAAADGHDVTLVTALSADAAGLELAALLAEAGVAVVDLRSAGATPEKIRLCSNGRCLLRLDRGESQRAAFGAPPEELDRLLAHAAAVLVSDYGRGMAEVAQVRGTASGHAPVVWDPHLCGPAPPPGCRLVTPNRKELDGCFPSTDGGGWSRLTLQARRARSAWNVHGVAVTIGAGGALLVTDDRAPLAVPATPANGDACGAGDRFAAVCTGRLADGALPSEAVVDAVAAASAYVAGGGPRSFFASQSPSAPERMPAEDAAALAAAVRQRGGTVVATGGCFDLVHAGHVSLLQAARALGDCLVVCLNSDRSVHRLKGPGRPVVAEADRVAVLMALGCVDAVAVFDDDTPVRVLKQIRPHVFAKGGDYAGMDLPEEAAMRRWGGQAVTLPYLRGRSTTELLRGAATFLQ